MTMGRWARVTAMMITSAGAACSREGGGGAVDGGGQSAAAPVVASTSTPAVDVDAAAVQRTGTLAEPPPPLAPRAAEVPDFRAKLAADPAYATIWTDKKREDLDLVLTAVSETLAAVGRDGNGSLPESVNGPLVKRKLMNLFFEMTAEPLRTGQLAPDVQTHLADYLRSLRTEPHLGVRAAAKSGKAPHNFAALAWWVVPRDPDYARELIASRQDRSFTWSTTRDPWLPYLARERAALERLAKITKLSDEETARLKSLIASEATFGSDPVEPIHLGDLLAEYGSNEVRADGKYKNKAVSFAGVAGEIQRGTIGGITLDVGTGKPFEAPKVRCFFDDSQTEKVKALSKGDHVRVRGVVNGLLMDVVVRHCEVLE